MQQQKRQQTVTYGRTIQAERFVKLHLTIH